MLVPFAVCLVLALFGPLSDTRLVAKIPDGCQIVDGTLRFSRDGTKCVYVAAKGEKEYPVVDAKLGEGFVDVLSAAIDPAGAHTAFRVRGTKKNRDVYSIVQDGRVVVSADWIGPVALDPLNGTLAYWTATGNFPHSDRQPPFATATLVWRKYKSKQWQFADDASPPQFSSDGKLIATYAARGRGEFNVLTVDDKGHEDKHGNGDIFEVTLHPRGRAFACSEAQLAGDDRWQDFPQQMRVRTASLEGNDAYPNGRTYGRKYESAGSPVYSADGQHVAYKVMQASKMGVAIDDQEDAACDYTFVDTLALNGNGSDVAFIACNDCTLDAKNGFEVLRGVKATGGKWFVAHGTVRSAECERAHLLSWSPNGESLAYAAKSDGHWYVFAGSKRGDPCDEVACITWSDDGRAVWYGCLQGAEIWWRKLDRE